MDTNKLIRIHDNLFTFDQRSNFFQVFKRSLFRALGEDSDLNLYPGQQLFSTYTLEDLAVSGFQNTEGYIKLDKEYNLSSRDIKQIRINLSTAAEKNSAHTDRAGVTLLYYPCTEWKIEWGGHTIFLNENADDIIYISAYKTGRVVVFDGTIPHLVIPPTALCPINRLVLAIQYT